MIAEWQDYALSDFLLFSSDTYWRLFELLNTALWPFHAVIAAGLLALLCSARLGWQWTGLAAGLGLALSWALTTALFLTERYQPINWTISFLIPVFWAQVVAFVMAGPWLLLQNRGWQALLGTILAIVALVYPLVGLAAGRPIVQAEFAGFAPDPTALFTLGLLAGVQGRLRLALAIVPIAWALVSITTLLTMQEWTGWILLAGLGLGTIALLPSRANARPLA